MKRRTVLTALTTASIAGRLDAFQSSSDPNHTAWVARTLQRMQAIKPGMTRTVLLTVFREEGGIYNASRRTYVSQDCPYFHVDVKFKAVDGLSREEDPRDVITEISRPYIDFYHAD